MRSVDTYIIEHCLICQAPEGTAIHREQQHALLDEASMRTDTDGMAERKTDDEKQSLSEVLRRLRLLSGKTLRDVEEGTGVSNAYLSQLENGSAKQPSPHVLHKLSEFYAVPYESLLDAAGYLEPAGPRESRRVGAIQAALMSAHLTAVEEAKVAEFIGFLRSQRRKKT